MRTTNSDIEEFEKAGVIDPSTALRMKKYLVHSGGASSPTRDPDSSGFSFSFVTLAYYGGALIVLSALTLLGSEFTRVWGALSLVIFGVSLAVISILAGRSAYRRGARPAASGFFAVAVASAPVIVFALLSLTGLTGPNAPVAVGAYEIDHLLMSASLTLAGLLALKLKPSTLIGLPLTAGIIWFMDSLIRGPLSMSEDLQFIAYGVLATLLLLLAIRLDKRFPVDLSVWLYAGSVMLYTFSLMGLELPAWVWLFVFTLLLFLGVLVRRRLLVVVGAFGGVISFHIWILDILPSGMPTILTLTVVGLLIIAVAVWYSKNELEINRKAQSLVPSSVREWLPPSP